MHSRGPPQVLEGNLGLAWRVDVGTCVMLSSDRSSGWAQLVRGRNGQTRHT